MKETLKSEKGSKKLDERWRQVWGAMGAEALERIVCLVCFR